MFAHISQNTAEESTACSLLKKKKSIVSVLIKGTDGTLRVRIDNKLAQIQVEDPFLEILMFNTHT